MGMETETETETAISSLVQVFVPWVVPTSQTTYTTRHAHTHTRALTHSLTRTNNTYVRWWTDCTAAAGQGLGRGLPFISWCPNLPLRCRSPRHTALGTFLT